VSAGPAPRRLVALGGNALLRRGEPADAERQRARVEEAAGALAALAADSSLVVTHGNGPQVGLLALQAAAYPEVAPYPLDLLDAETEGMVGYLLELALRNALGGNSVATLLTQVVVDAEDRAFAHPTKPIGPAYAREEAARLARERGWAVAPDAGAYRRVVASPEPCRIVELDSIELLLGAGVTVICAGGGGIPVTARNGSLTGVEAVVDKDLTAALLAERLGATQLLLLTDVAAVERGWGTSRARPILRATPRALRRLDFAAGSMSPKVEAACRFVERTGGTAAIGSLDQAAAVARGDAGTQIAASARGGAARAADAAVLVRR
jgi:carbamate kinase